MAAVGWVTSFLRFALISPDSLSSVSVTLTQSEIAELTRSPGTVLTIEVLQHLGSTEVSSKPGEERWRIPRLVHLALSFLPFESDRSIFVLLGWHN